MTVPRIRECAKALMLGDLGPPPEGIDAFWETCFDGAKERYLGIALAVILKWLEQPSTLAMDEAGEAHGVRDAEPVYAAMCTQAAKEITE
jgi:hypothetical protein